MEVVNFTSILFFSAFLSRKSQRSLRGTFIIVIFNIVKYVHLLVIFKVQLTINIKIH